MRTVKCFFFSFALCRFSRARKIPTKSAKLINYSSKSENCFDLSEDEERTIFPSFERKRGIGITISRVFNQERIHSLGRKFASSERQSTTFRFLSPFFISTQSLSDRLSAALSVENLSPTTMTNSLRALKRT